MAEAVTRAKVLNDRVVGWVELISWLLIAAGLISVLQALPVNRLIEAVTGWVQGFGVLGPIVFAGVYIVVTVLFLPGSPFSIAAGALFGLAEAFLAVLVGATLGAGVAFLIARYAARNAIERRLKGYPKFKAVDRAVAEGGWKIVALLRLSPAVPFNLQNYLYGLTAIRFWPCMLATAVAMIPGIFLYVYVGYASRAGLEAATSGEAEGGFGRWILLGVGLVATIVVTVYVTRLARRAIQSQTDVESFESNEEKEEPVSNEPTKADLQSGPGRHSWVKAGGLATVAVVIFFLGISVQLRADWLTQWFGPPKVTMTEAYAPKPSGPTFDHSRLDRILKRYVDANGGVDYSGLAENPKPLLEYNASLEDAPFDKMGRNEKLALLINAYNSFTLELILEWLGRGIDSIKDIPKDQRWQDARWNIGGHVWSLNEIEHKRIRPHFQEPNVHWALVCAAVGCPPLRREAYSGDRIEKQLTDQARRVHTNESRWFRYDRSNGTIHLTPLYKWYSSDFEQAAGTILKYAAQYFKPLGEDLKAGKRPAVRWLDYDWSLNSQKNLP